MKLSKPQIFFLITIIFASILHLFISFNIEGHLFNDGIAFGIGDGAIVILINLVALILLLFILFKAPHRHTLPLITILVGGASNFLDRIIDRGVADYINLKIGFIPIFNINDILISVGIIYLLLIILQENERV